MLSWRLPCVDTLLSRIAEQCPHDFPRYAEIQALSRVFSAAQSHSNLTGEDDAGIHMPGLDWLCSQSNSFRFAAATVVDGCFGQMTLVLTALANCVQDQSTLPSTFFDGDRDEPLSPKEASAILPLVSRLVPLREFMGEKQQTFWRGIVVDVFRALKSVPENEREYLSDIASEFFEDMASQNAVFVLGYLAHVAGNSGAALSHYLHDVSESKDPPENALNNIRVLLTAAEDLEDLEPLLLELKEALTTTKRPDAVEQLLKEAKGKQDEFQKQEQFEKTALSRWPTISAPARKVLGVLAMIQRYNGFAELGSYAGMDTHWAQVHYNKLVELGMVIDTGKSYRINPHIQPLIEREAQHAVVGRIVRSQGTSAIKPVFNSQREYSIYQVMVQLCPNHLVFPNCALQSIMQYEKMKELVGSDEFGYYLRASVDIVVVSSTTFLPLLAIEVDSVWHDTEKQQAKDVQKDTLFATAGIPFLRLQPVGNPSETTVRGQVAEHLDDLVRVMRADMPGYDQARVLLQDLSKGTETRQFEL